MNSQKEIVHTLIQPQAAEMLNLIRLRKNTETSVEALRECMDISRSTADKIFNGLAGKDNALGETASLVFRDERRTVINSVMAYFLGISIGSRYIRIVLLNLNFEPVALDSFFSVKQAKEIDGYKDEEESNEDSFLSYTYEIPDQVEDKLEFIRKVISQIVSGFLDCVACNANFPLLGIGFGVTGPVDYREKIWRSSPRITDIQNITIADIIGYENKQRIDEMELFLSLDNNAKTAAISEYQNLLEKTNGQYSEDLAVIYIGSGVGLASVIDGRLLRSDKNMAGELGHVQLLIGKDDKSENKDENFYQTKSVEELFTDDFSYRKYLPYILNLINCTLGVSRFILVGHSISKRDVLVNEIMNQRFKFTVSSTQTYCSAEIGRGVAYTAAIGAAMEVYYTVCNYAPYNNAQERTNLAQRISWGRN